MYLFLLCFFYFARFLFQSKKSHFDLCVTDSFVVVFLQTTEMNVFIYIKKRALRYSY